MPELALHDTRLGAKTPLVPRDPSRVGIYTCGPTVYGRAHVGNARHYVVFSLLKRFLSHQGYTVTLVSNLTDINDKIYAAARAANIPSARLAEEMSAAYVADTDALGLGRPDHEPTATGAMGEIIELITTLIDGGHAYVADGDVYFSVGSYPRYGELSHRRLEDMDQGEGGEGVARKREPADFALWKATKVGEDTAWDAPWGRGRPGWHIECSAMAESLLGMGFEIHGGGSDLIFPHHENEAAQSGAAHGGDLARLWVHVGMVRTAAEKMSKSLANTFLLHEAVAAHGRDALILYFVARHYRQPVEWSDALMAEARENVRRLREAGRRLHSGPSPDWSGPLRDRFLAALADDFNTPGALAMIWEWVREANRSDGPVGSDDLTEMLGLLGLENLLVTEPAVLPSAVDEIVAAREQARTQRDWAEADRLRAAARALGWEIRDGADGPHVAPLT
ncbi:cysteine--tRNA ligase [Conexibacter sp. DBS9H8]|uniref:cysteine--tRNA ligase n=1 Tax=Conexibacter sp. DBS9H8 TaxID=2937801 RepID=UPI00200F46C2|nr:cysteine--tRNA ligase [Conexibacter sp. DBS9H8]